MRLRFILVPMLLTLACDPGDDESEFRAANDGDGDFAIHDGPDASNPDCLIFDIVGSDVYDGAASNGVVIASFTDTGISTTDGGSCTFDSTGPMLRLRNEDGDAVFTVWQKWVLDGDFVIPPTAGGIAADTAYTFQTDHVYAGLPTSSNMVATSTENVQFASASRKLLVTALLEGTCSREAR